ncbi:hypothetical protein [Endozoicomonas sp. 4G]|uniref:hypothetical protein n=1 Tax=Endozoicomonas sp. 4G TaxID=2872754 RepID=UPI002078F038|nr:hypothetical protein [Endozoicomonas sp. 4G]
MHFYRLFRAFVLFLLAVLFVPLCHSTTITDRHNPGGHGGVFFSPPPPPWGGSRPSGLFEIDLVILKPVITWLMSKFLERTGLQAGNVHGQPSGSPPDAGSKDENNHHQKGKREEPEDQESQSPGDGNNGSGDGNNRKDDNGEESENNASTQELQALANLLIAIIESGDPDAVFKLRQILDDLDTPQRLQVLVTKSTNSIGETVTPLEAILQLQRSFNEDSLRNRFLEQLIEATSDETRTLNDPDILSSLQPMIPPDWSLPEAGNNNLMILHKIVLNIIHRVNQSDRQPPIGQFEKRCLTEYFVQLFLLYSNPLESICELLRAIPDPVIIRDILMFAPSLTFSIPFRDTLTQLELHPSSNELMRFSNRLCTLLLPCIPTEEPSAQGSVARNNDNTSNEIIADNANTFTDSFRQVDSGQNASGVSASSPGSTTDRYLQSGARPKQCTRAGRQKNSGQDMSCTELERLPESSDTQGRFALRCDLFFCEPTGPSDIPGSSGAQGRMALRCDLFFCEPAWLSRLAGASGTRGRLALGCDFFFCETTEPSHLPQSSGVQGRISLRCDLSFCEPTPAVKRD